MASSHDPLKLLISSMDTNEKRYFKLLSTAFKSNSKTLQLFDLLDSQEDLSDNELMVRLNVSSINSIRMLLRKQLLRAMRIYQEERNERSAMRGTIGEIEFLLSKQLTGEAEKEIRKAYKKAESVNDHLALYELTLRNNEIRKQFRTSQDLVDEFEDRISKMENQCARLLNLGRLRIIDTEWNLYIQNFDRGDSERNRQFFYNQIEPFLNELKLNNSAPLETIHSAILRSGFNTLLGDVQVSESVIEQANRLFDLDNQLLINRFSMFVALNYNHSCGLFIREMVNESLNWTLSTEEVLDRYYDELLKIHGDEVCVRFRYLLLSGRIRALNRLGRFSESLLLEPNYRILTEAGWQVIFNNTRVLLSLRFASAHFHLGQYRSALVYLEKGLSMKEVRDIDLLRSVYLLAEGLCYLMLGNWELAETKLSNLYKGIMRTDSKAGFKSGQIEFVRKISTIQMNNDVEEAKQLRSRLEKEKSDGLVLDFINLPTWLSNRMVEMAH